MDAGRRAGRQLFETDATLVTSDQIEEGTWSPTFGRSRVWAMPLTSSSTDCGLLGDEVVEVDASLFANLHDLDLEDDDQEDRSFLFADDD